MKRALKKNDIDNVATVLESIEAGETVQLLSEKKDVIDEIICRQRIPFGNKIAICDIAKESQINKCGYKIGKSFIEILKGDLVHVHNVKSERINFPEPIIDEIIRQMKLEIIR